jgi:Tol biopolymer transport system component
LIREESMRRLLLFLVVAVVPPAAHAQDPAPAKLLIAFASVRERRAPPYPKIYFYEHDGVASGKIVGSIDTIGTEVNKSRADMHPSLSHDGRFCAFSGQMGITDGARIEVWDRQEKKLLDLPELNVSKDVHQMTPSMTADGKHIFFSAWNRPGGTPRWGVYHYDTTAKKLIDLPGLNGTVFDQRMPAISADGKVLAHASNAKNGVGLTDVFLYDMADKKVVLLPEMNSKNMDIQPALSGDGRLIAFSSDRPGGQGGRDIYLYDRIDRKFQPLPDLNSPGPEQSPSLSADGRYLAFVSERPGGSGERDVYLYDRQTRKLLPTPGLNSKDDDFDPCVIVLPASK